MGVVIGEGTHRVVLRHRSRGLGAGLAAAALAGGALGLAWLAERRERRRV
jgi:hypothetical protein